MTEEQIVVLKYFYDAKAIVPYPQWLNDIRTHNINISEDDLSTLTNSLSSLGYIKGGIPCNTGITEKGKIEYEKAIKQVEAKQTSTVINNVIENNYGNSFQGRDFEIRDQNFSNNPPNQNISTNSQKSFWQKTLQFIVDNIVKIIVGVIIGLIATYFGLKNNP